MRIDKIILYTPKAEKLCSLTNLTSALITNKETIKATNEPTSRNIHSFDVKFNPDFNNLNSDAPAITGMAIKNENSATTGREIPVIIPPKIVDPDLLVPGIRASIWNAPIFKLSM